MRKPAIRKKGKLKVWTFVPLILTIGNVNSNMGVNDFCYKGPNGPEYWCDRYPMCGGRSQSPINIDTCLVSTDAKLPPLQFGDGFKENINGKLENNGHTVIFTPSESHRGKLTVCGGPFGDDRYCLEKVVFRWGSENSRGSEHTINGHRFPLEMQLVHRNQKYASKMEAKDKPDGFMAIAVMFELDPYKGDGKWMEGVKPYTKLCDDICHCLERIQHPGRSIAVPAVNMSEAFHVDFHEYFLYTGSCPKPPCNEGAKWIVPTCFSYITCEQLESFRKLIGKDGKCLSDNYRPTQPLNHRKVYKVCNRAGYDGMQPGGGYRLDMATMLVPPVMTGPDGKHKMYPHPAPPMPLQQHYSPVGGMRMASGDGRQLTELSGTEDMRHYSDAIKQKILSAYESGSSLDDIKRSLGLMV